MFRCLLIICVFLIGAVRLPAQQKGLNGSGRPSPKRWLQARENAQIRPLRLLTWNLYLLPGMAPCPGRVKRAKAIGSVLRHSGYDVLCLQETFHRKARLALIDSLRDVFPYFIGPIHPDRPFRTSSGLMIFSRTPFDSLGVIAYKQNRRSDVVAQKGAVLVRGTHEGKRYQLCVTHAQSENEPLIRRNQFRQLFQDLLSLHRRDGELQLVCGDMNVPNQDTLEFRAMLNALQVHDCRQLSDSLCSYTPGRNLLAGNGNSFTLDYFLANIPKPAAGLGSKVVVFQKPWSKKHSDLSDHYAVEWEVLP